MCFQDEKDFTLQVPKNTQNDRIYIKGKKADVSAKRLYHGRNKFSKKIMVSCVVCYEGVSQPFFMNPEKTKVNGENYTNHLETDLLPECRLLCGLDFIYVHDGAPSHTSAVCQNFLRANLGDNFISKEMWPPYSPDCNPLDYYYFWDALSNQVYLGRTEPFENLEELKQRIIAVWDDAIDLVALRKALDRFRPRLRAVVKTNGKSIKAFFG